VILDRITLQTRRVTHRARPTLGLRASRTCVRRDLNLQAVASRDLAFWESQRASRRRVSVASSKPSVRGDAGIPARPPTGRARSERRRLIRPRAVPLADSESLGPTARAASFALSTPAVAVGAPSIVFTTGPCSPLNMGGSRRRARTGSCTRSCPRRVHAVSTSLSIPNPSGSTSGFVPHASRRHLPLVTARHGACAGAQRVLADARSPFDDPRRHRPDPVSSQGS